MKTITTCSNVAEAELLKSLLEAGDIKAFVPEELDSFASSIRLQVEDEDVAEARRLLATAQFPPDARPGEDQPRG